MPEDQFKTADMNCRSKEELFARKHPLVREILQIPEIIMEGEDSIQKVDCLSLKELFTKKNMDTYHVDCLILRKIARNVLSIMKKLGSIPVYPGLYDLEDIYVDLSHSGYPVLMLHPEKFQLMSFEQDYEWYPEDERVFGEISIFDENSQAVANQRLLYKILIASPRGNVRIPPRTSRQDYSTLFYGTLPSVWKEIFEQDRVETLDRWDEWLEEAICLEENYEKEIREKKIRTSQMEVSGQEQEEAVSTDHDTGMLPSIDLYCLFAILRTERSNSLEMSRMLYEAQDQLELERSHGPVHLEQAFIYGDGVIECKDFREYEQHYRVQIPQHIREYSIVEALLIACEWMKIIRKKNIAQSSARYRLYILSDGRVANNAMYSVCLKKISGLMDQGVEIRLIEGKDAGCEGFEQLKTMINRG